MGKLTQAQLAEKWGVSRPYINKLVKSGQLPTDEKNKIDEDIAEAVRLAQDPSKRQGQEVNRLTGGNRGPGTGKANESAPAQATANVNTLAQARTANEVMKARTAELKYRQMAGQLVERDKVKSSAHGVGRTLMQRIMALPNRVGPMIAPMTDPNECRKLLEEEMKELVQQLTHDLLTMVEDAK